MMRKKTLLMMSPVLAGLFLFGCQEKAASKEGDKEKETTTESTEKSMSSGSPTTLDVAAGEEIGYVYEAFLSPHQEPGEEKDTPEYIPSQFQSTTESKLRSERQSRGHGRVRFTKDLSKAYVDVKVEGLKIEEINMFHIHCGRPDQLGPILVDFALITDIQKNFNDDGVMSLVVTNKDIEAEAAAGEGLIGAFTAGCPIIPGQKDKVKTVAGMEYIASHGELYFNLHTTGQTYFGDIRGRIRPVEIDDEGEATAIADTMAGAVPASEAPAPTGEGHMHH